MESKKFSLGGFPPIYEKISEIKSKEFKPNTILSIQAILSKRNLNRINDIHETDKIEVNRIRDKSK